MPLDYGFLFSAKLENGVVINMSDQDYIHNHKKADRHLDHASRELRMGPYLVHRNILRQLAQNFNPHVHGLRDEDTNRRDMQNWTACQRIAFPKVRKCLWKMARGLDGVPQNEQALGLWVYLDMIYDYVEKFVSLKASYYQRIINAGYVVTFLGIWRNHVIRSRGLTLSKNFLSRETFQDLLLSYHFVVMLIADFSLHFPYLECPLDRTGEDGCEVFFSLNGSSVQNHHAYTTLDMVRNHSSITRIAEINSTNPKLKLRRSNSKQDNIWDKQYEPGNRAKTYDPKGYPTEEEIVNAWREGIEKAHRMARLVGLDRPANDSDDDNSDDDDDGSSPEWFDKPYKNIFLA